MTKAPDYNLASLNAETIAAICHRATVLRIWAGPEGVASEVKQLDAQFRRLAERLGYTVAIAVEPVPQTLDVLLADDEAAQ